MNLDSEIPWSCFEFPKLTVSVYSDNILHVYIKPEALLEIQDIQKVITYVSSLGPQKFLNLFEFARYSSTDHAVRKWASDPEGNTRTIADALVIKGLDQKIIADIYLKFNNPVKPTRIFNNVPEAINWLLTFKPSKDLN